MHYPIFLTLSILLSSIPFWNNKQPEQDPISAHLFLQHLSTQLLIKDYQDHASKNKAQKTYRKSTSIIQCIHQDRSLKGLSEREKKRVRYIRRFHKTAIEERKQFGIPASIKLAQGILESQQGTSTLTRKYKNHFGIKCSSKEPSCNCAVYADDKPDDRFKIYSNDWTSFRDHSLFLQKKRYKKLYAIPVSDYVNWAKGLKKAGYATDPHYATKLIQIIESLELYRFDQDVS